MPNIFELEVMKIHFTKEYRLLVDMLYIADWVMHSHELVDERSHKEHEDLYEKIKSYYREMEKAEDVIKYSKETDSYYETREYEEKALEEFITPYDEDIFWEELVDRLSKRDVFRKIGIEKYNAMELIERIKMMSEVEERYEDERAAQLEAS